MNLVMSPPPPLFLPFPEAPIFFSFENIGNIEVSKSTAKKWKLWKVIERLNMNYKTEVGKN